MELDERKKKILQAVIKNYLETGEPVGYRTISKYTDLNLSSATLRNEMADLEELGYIFQPHTSAGRIPTDMGYRLYVDDMLSTREKELDKKDRKLDDKAESLKTMQEIMDKRVDRIEEVLKDVPYYRNNGLVRDSVDTVNLETASPDADTENLDEGED